MPRAIAVPAICLAILCAGCNAERDAQIAVQAALTGLAHGVHAADTALQPRYAEAADEAQEQVLEEREAALAAGDTYTVEHGMERYDELIEPYEAALTALRAIRSVLYVGQGALDSWVGSGELPNAWGSFCGGIEDAVQGVLSTLASIGVEVPATVVSLSNFADTACETAGPWFHPTIEAPGEED